MRRGGTLLWHDDAAFARRSMEAREAPPRVNEAPGERRAGQ